MLELTIAIKAIGDAAGKIGEVQEQLQGLQRVGDRMGSVGRNLTTGLTLPIVGALGAATAAAISFEESFADVRKTMSATEAEFAAIEQSLIEMSTVGGLPLLPQELAAIAAAGGQMGVAAGDIEQFVETAAKMSIAFNTSAEAAGSAMATISNVLQIPISEMEAFGGVINHLSNNMNATAPDIVEGISRIGGTARNFGLANEEAAALVSTMVSMGKTPEVASTALNTMMLRLQTATQQGGKFGEGLEDIGLSAQAMESNVRESGIGAIQDLMSRLGELDAMDRTAVLAKLFGTEFADDMSLLAGNAELLDQALGLANDQMATGSSLQDEFAARSATTANQIALLRNNAVALGIQVGNVILPALSSLLEKITPIVTGMAQFAAAHPGIVQVAIAIGLVLAAIGPLLIGIGAIINAVIAIKSAFAAVGAIMAVIGGVISAPLLIAIAVATALAAIAFVVWRNWSTIGPAIGNVIRGIAAAFASAAQAIVNGVITIGQRAMALVGIFNTVRGQIIAVLQGMAGAMMQAGANLISSLVQGIRSKIGEARAAIASVASTIRGALPFSPPEWGPLSDIMQAGPNIVNSIAGGITPGPIASAMQGALAPAGGMMQRGPTPVASGGGGGAGGANISVNVTVNTGAGVAPESVADSLEERLREVLPRLMAEANRNQMRVSYG